MTGIEATSMKPDEEQSGLTIDYHFSLRVLLSLIQLDIIGSSAFGLDVDCVKNADAPLSVAYHNLVSEFPFASLFAFSRCNFTCYPINSLRPTISHSI